MATMSEFFCVILSKYGYEVALHSSVANGIEQNLLVCADFILFWLCAKCETNGGALFLVWEIMERIPSGFHSVHHIFLAV